MQVKALRVQLAEDDGIYMLHQICTARFSHSRNIPYHPAGVGIQNNLKRQVVQIQSLVLGGDTCKLDQICKSPSSKNTDRQVHLIALDNPSVHLSPPQLPGHVREDDCNGTDHHTHTSQCA